MTRSPSSVLRAWCQRDHWKDYVTETPDDPSSTEWHSLRGMSGPNEVRISFGLVPGRPEVVRVRSTNWRCEHEPHGFMLRESARRLYQECLDCGMVPC